MDKITAIIYLRVWLKISFMCVRRVYHLAHICRAQIDWCPIRGYLINFKLDDGIWMVATPVTIVAVPSDMTDEDGPPNEDADMMVDVWERLAVEYAIEVCAVDAMAAVTTMIDAVCWPAVDEALISLLCWAVFANFSKTSSKL